MIRASGITLRRGTKVLLDDTSFVVNPVERLGIVGKNGAGKSTLFALLKGELDLDAGNLEMPAAWRIASVEQEIQHPERPAREFVIDGDQGLRQLQAEREQTPDANGHRIAELETALVEADSWTAPSRAEQLLAGLGFAPDTWMKPVNEFSGGWQMRLALARALMAPSELLLLDEPTNHLDLDAMLWLEKWLAAYAGTVIVISHDTEFLNAVARSILHFDQAKLVRYKGGYEQFIDRFKAKATKAKQAQSRVKALARMETLAPLQAEAGIDLYLPSPDSMPDPLLILDGITTGYQSAQGETPILKNINLMLRGGARIGVLGVNGAGKSTLVKTLAQELPALAGHYRPSKGLNIGYFAQHQLEMLDAGSTPLQHLARIAPEEREQTLRNYLGRFGFSGDMVNQNIAPLSGGEKARLALSLIVWQKPNLLLLDEPSNHLDVDTREALATALAEYDGSMLLVSHDRHLLRTTVDEFWIVADGGVAEFDGDLDDYRNWLLQRGAQQRAEAREEARDAGTNTGTAGETEVDRKARKRLEAEARQRLSTQRKPLEKDLGAIEKKMDSLRARLQTLDATIADTALYTDARRDERVKVLAEHGELNKQLEQAETRWLELQEEIEALEQQFNEATQP